MDDLRSTLEGIERQVHAGPGALERVRTEHRRRHRNRRVATTAVQAVVVVVAVAAIAVTLRFLQRSDQVAAPPIDATNVTNLAPTWQRHISGGGSTRAVVADGTVFVASDDGRLHALDARTGETRWVGQTVIGAPTSPVVANGTVLLHVASQLYAFDVACASGGATCTPRWSARTGGGNEAPPTVADGIVYVVATPGGISAFPLACTMACTPLWTAPELEGHQARSVAVADGVVWDSSPHALSAFPTDCGSAGATCRALVADITPDGADLASPPAVADGVVYVGASDGRLFAVPTACATGGSCDPLWQGQTGGAIAATPLVVGDRVYAASSDGLVYAFPTACADQGASCPALWIGRTGGPLNQPPAAANGLVFVASTDGSLSIFRDHCGTGGAECVPLRVEPIGDLPPSPSVWGDRALLTIAADGRLSAWTVGGASLAGVR